METPFNVINSGEFLIIEFLTNSMMNASELERMSIALNRLADEQKNGKIVLDCTKVEYISSQAIGIVMGLNKKTSSVRGGKLVLCGVCPQLLQVLKITRLDRLLKIVKTQLDAMK